MLNGSHGNKTHHGICKQDRTIESLKYEIKGENFPIFPLFIQDITYIFSLNRTFV